MATRRSENPSRRSTSASDRRSDRTLTALAWAVWVGVSMVQAQTLDRTLAMVAGHVIMQSDVEAFQRLGLFAAVPDADGEADTLTRLIERRLVLDVVDRYAVADPPPAVVEQQFKEIRGRFSSEAAFEVVLLEVGYTADDLRQVIRDNLRRDTYVDERFAAVRLPSEDQLRTYFDTHVREFSGAGAPVTFDEARPRVLQRVVAEARAETIAEWIAGLVRRAQIMRMTPSPPPSSR